MELFDGISYNSSHKGGVMEELTILSQKLKSIRKELHQSQMEFAFNCGVSTETISLIERKKASPNLDTVQKIASYLGITVSELLMVD